MIKETTAEKILDYILSHGGDFGEVFYEDTSFTKLRMTGKEIETVSAGNETGTGIRIFQNGASLYFYTEGGEEETLFRLLKENWKGGKPQVGIFGLLHREGSTMGIRICGRLAFRKRLPLRNAATWQAFRYRTGSAA